MSWNGFIDTLLNGRCSYAAICGRDPVSFWAESQDKSNFPVTIEDVGNLIKIIVNQDMAVYNTGFMFGGKLKFTVIILTKGLIILQGKHDIKHHSCVVALTSQTCIIGHNHHPEVKTVCIREVVESIQQYLTGVNY